ncbi:WXG100 family type VII secretion target [Antrihabitans stalactiti]|uniref:PPE domain-containing protein n=1 Tax=Antrihabitans stalactiti TaxID=2584121 RepID=A0A848KQB7_9NOCA|nr:hypothetical protein [Antrihabitans stalactiti]NMN97807.1 hypothetical protein [Antrihabitans stalactiti]
MNAENPYSFTHKEIKAAFEAMNPESARTLTRNSWVTAGTQWTAALETFRSAIATAQNAAWQGVAAEKATSSITDYTRSSSKLNDAIDRVVKSIDSAADSVSRTKANIPNVPESDGSSEREKVISDAEQDAQVEMANGYTTPLTFEFSRSARLPRAESVIDYGRNLATEHSTTSSTTQTGDNPSSTNSTSTTSTSTDPNALTSNDRAVNTDNESTTTNPQTLANNRPTTDTATDTSNNDQDAKVTPTSFNPNQEDSIRPAATTPTGPTPISPGLSPNTTTTNPGPSTLQPSPLGTQNVSNPNTPAGPISTSAAPRSSTAAPGGLMPHGAGRQGGEDKEHKTPSYLVNEENGNELIGPIPKTTPPVIGA